MTGLLPNLTVTEFIKLMKQRWDAEGVGFTPFLGSGISAQSGIIMSQEFSDFLAYAVYRTLDGGPLKRGHWDLRARGWPPQPTSTELKSMYSYFFALYKKQAARYSFKLSPQDPDQDHKIEKVEAITLGEGIEHGSVRDIHMRRPLVPTILRHDNLYHGEDELAQMRRHRGVKNEPSDLNLSPSSLTYVEDCALRALSHWTDTLEFLTKIRIGKVADEQKVYLTTPDTSVIDNFNRHITRGKRPNLIHNMIARLARSLRSHVLLTTNFDELTEESFRAQGEPLYVIPVSIKGDLPSFATVRAQDCLIKLHGDMLETRADSSINQPPSESDKEKFFQYLRGPNSPDTDQPNDFIQSDLLVLGYSASDARCVQMIKYVLEMDPHFHVFWICHSPRDLGRIQDQIFNEYILGNDPTALPRFHVVVTDRADLLLWELYQQVNLSLPGGGYSIQFSHHVPPARFDRPTEADSERFVQVYNDALKLTSTDVIYYEGTNGTARPMAEVFHLFQAHHHDALWLELEDYRDPIDLFFHVVCSMSIRRGYFQLEWANFLPPLERVKDAPLKDAEKTLLKQRLRLLIDKYGIVPDKWVLFLYGRNGAGGCTGWEVKYWSEKEKEDLKTIIRILRDIGMRIIVLRNGEERAKRNRNKSDIITQCGNKIALQFDNTMSPALRDARRKSGITLMPEQPKGKAESQLNKWFRDYYTALTKDYPGASNAVYPPNDIASDGYTHFKADALTALSNPVLPSYETIIKKVLDNFLIQDASKASLVGTRMLWLYGQTLFRQSRHPAAMISEAVIPCPEKFNPKFTDNDELRYSLVFTGVNRVESLADSGGLGVDYEPEKVGWLPWLSKCNVFLRKPGGYAWMYRDIRLGLQSILERTGPFSLPKKPLDPTTWKDEIIECAGLLTIRPGIHYLIGDWYLRAYYATGHYIPLIESLYHTVQCLRLSTIYVPPKRETWSPLSVFKSRILLFWAALCQFRRLLRVGRTSLFFWAPGIDIAHTFFDTEYNEDEQLTVSSVNLIQNAFVELESQAETLKRQESRKTSTPSDEELQKSSLLKGLRERCVIHINSARLELEQLRLAVLAEGNAHGRQSSPMTAKTRASHAPQRKQNRENNDNKLAHSIGDVANSDDEWATTFVKLLSEGVAFCKSNDLQRLFKHPEEFISHNFQSLRYVWLQNWASQGAPEEKLYELLWILTEAMYHLVRRAKLLELVPEPSRDRLTEMKPRSIWQGVCALGYLSLRLAQYLSPDHYYSECDQRVRILTLYGTALGALNRFSEANRRFNEAHALVVSGMGFTDGKELARIHIRRAETLLTRASVELHKDNRDQATNHRRAISFVDDCWAALERGENCLCGISHSSFWWYRLILLRLQCYKFVGEIRQSGQSSDDFPHSLPFRRRLHLPTAITELLRDALIIGSGDAFRQIRSIDFAISAHTLANELGSPVFGKSKCQKCVINVEHEISSFINTILNSDDPKEKPLLKAYRESVKEKFSRLECFLL